MVEICWNSPGFGAGHAWTFDGSYPGVLLDLGEACDGWNAYG